MPKSLGRCYGLNSSEDDVVVVVIVPQTREPCRIRRVTAPRTRITWHSTRFGSDHWHHFTDRLVSRFDSGGYRRGPHARARSA